MWKMREKETEAQKEIIKPIVGLSRRGLRTDGEGAFGRRSSRVFYTLQLSLSLRVCVYFSFFSLPPPQDRDNDTARRSETMISRRSSSLLVPFCIPGN